jgi:NAD(P)-dependent dehydrogenase (short-subunit alcohol dehydrogenase family)
MDTKAERHVVITGGTGALGTAVVARMKGEGAHCHVTYVDDGELSRFAHRDTVTMHKVDVASESDVAAFYAALPAVSASVHLVGGFEMSKIEATSQAAFERMFRLNAVTAFLCCREAIARMRQGGGGRIVNVAARPALEPNAGMAAYATSKSAVAALTRLLASEVLAEGILVNAVVPSTMDTAANRRAMPNADFDRWPKVDQVADAIAFLAGPSNALTSGALLPVYGRA